MQIFLDKFLDKDSEDKIKVKAADQENRGNGAVKHVKKRKKMSMAVSMACLFCDYKSLEVQVSR